MVFIVSTAALLAVVISAKFLRAVSTMVSTLTVGSLNSPAILVKSKSVKGFLKVPLAYMGDLLTRRSMKDWAEPLCCGAQRPSIYACAAPCQEYFFVHCT